VSPVRRRDRRRLAGPSHLVLVRGGLERAEPVDPDWQSFCERIGWQPSETALPDDYEDRLAERIFREMDEGQRVAGALAPERPRARRTLAAAANVAVLAVLCAAASAMLWWAARSPVSALPRPDAMAPQRATTAKAVDGDAPSAQPRDSAPLPRDVPTRPAPSEMKTATPRTVGPGSRVAQRSRRDEGGARRTAEALARGAPPVQGSSRAAVESVAPIAVAALRPEGFDLPRALPPISRVWPEPVASDAWTRQASFGRTTPASATWSLSPDSPRWYGVGLPPPGASAGLPPAVGVMAQLDVGKAIARF
jgi:hypothetical protein